MAYLPMSFALDVRELASIRIHSLTPTRKRKPRKEYPIYGNYDLNVILRFLAAYLAEFQLTLEAERTLAKGSEHIPIFAGRVKYREHQVVTVKELVKRAYWPQKHLSEMSNEDWEQWLFHQTQP